ncbi:hypothetical protein K5549_000513, partial [Capra hircus]
MPDLLLLGLIGGLTLLLLLTLLAFAGYSGLLAGVTVSAGSPPIRNVTVAYKFHVGPYGETGPLFTESCSISPRLRSIAVYYDNPHMVPPEKCRCAVGSILSEGEESPSPELIRLYQKFGFKVFCFPAPSHVVTATFPYTTPLSIWLVPRRVHPALDAYIKERKLCAHPRLEIYQEDQIYFMCPLARQGDFYVPEVKETERKSRGPAEANDALVDGTGTGSGVRVGSHLEPPPGCVGLVAPGRHSSAPLLWAQDVAQGQQTLAVPRAGRATASRVPAAHLSRSLTWRAREPWGSHGSALRLSPWGLPSGPGSPVPRRRARS